MLVVGFGNFRLANIFLNPVKLVFKRKLESLLTLAVAAIVIFSFFLCFVAIEILLHISGGLEKWSGSPILLDSSFEKDSGIEQALQVPPPSPSSQSPSPP